MSAKFTKGPWVAVVHDGSRSGKMYAVRSGMLHHDLCYVLDGLGSKNPVADCRLIAAAPDLYEYVRSHAERGDIFAVKLLAKADGEKS